MSIVIIAFCAMFFSNVLSGFRSRSTALNQPYVSAGTNALQVLGELLVMAMIAKQDSWAVIAASTIAAGLGYFLSMKLHTRMNRKYFAELKAKKKAKHEKRVRRAVQEELSKVHGNNLAWPLLKEQQ